MLLLLYKIQIGFQISKVKLNNPNSSKVSKIMCVIFQKLSIFYKKFKRLKCPDEPLHHKIQYTQNIISKSGS